MHAERDARKSLSRREFLKESVRYGAGVGALASIPLAVFGSEETQPVVEISPLMQKLGFELVPHEGTHELILPIIEIPSYRPDREDVPGVGFFTQIERLPQDRMIDMVTVETSEGERGEMLINYELGAVFYTNWRGRKKEKSQIATYEPDKMVREWVRRNEALLPVPAFFRYDEKQQLTVWKNPKKPDDRYKKIHMEKLVLPKGIAMRILLDRYLKVTDRLGKEFTQGVAFGPGERSKHLLISLNPFGVEEDKGSFDYTIGMVSSGSTSVQELLDHLMITSIYKQEFDERAQNIWIGEQNIIARGPNRNGDFELTSGKTSIIYHPADGSLQLARGWNVFGAVSRIIGGNLAQGTLVVKDDYGEGGYQVWRLHINFNNTDPQASYTAILLEDTTTKK